METKLAGGCVHHDNGPLGAMAIDRAEERRVQLLKSLGYNAIRTNHNPVSPAFLEACDREGMLVSCHDIAGIWVAFFAFFSRLLTGDGRGL